MESRDTIEAGGLTLVIAALLTGVFMMLADYGLATLLVMNVAIGFLAMGFGAFWRPDLAPMVGISAVGHSVLSFVVIFHDPIWALPGIIGGMLCVAGGVSYDAPATRPLDDETGV